MKEVTMSINQFMQVQRGELTYKEIQASRYVENRIMSDKRLRAMATFVTGTFLYCEKAMAAADLSKLDNGGMLLLEVVRRFGYWVCIIMCITEIIRTLMRGDYEGIGKIVMKYSLAFASFYFLPYLFDIIKGIFS